MNMRLGVALIACLVMFCAGCSHQNPVRFANVPQDWFNAPILFAINGWSDQPAVHVSTFAMASGLASETAVVSGHAELGLASPIVLLRDPSAMKRVRILGCYMSSASVLGIATRNGTIKQPVGYVANTISEVFLARYMDKIGLGAAYDHKQIEKVSLLPPNMIDVIQGGLPGKQTVNSVVIWDPHLSRAADVMGGAVIRDPSIYTMHVCLISNRSLARKSSSEINNFVAIVKKASKYAMLSQMNASARAEQLTGLPTGTLKDTWKRVDFSYVSGHAELTGILNQEISALKSANMLTISPDPNAYL